MDQGEAGQEVMEDQPSIRDGSEGLVSGPHIEISPVNLDNAPNLSPPGPIDRSDDCHGLLISSDFCPPGRGPGPATGTLA